MGMHITFAGPRTTSVNYGAAAATLTQNSNPRYVVGMIIEC